MATLSLKNDAVAEVAQLLIDVVGADEVATSKLSLGAAGVNDGFVSKANGLPVSSNTAADGSGTEKRLLADADGNLQVDVVASGLPTGAATAANQTTANGSLASIDAKITAVDTGAVVVAGSALPTGAATAAKQDTGNTSLASIDGKITAVNTGAVVVSSSALPSGAATAAKQPALGTAGTASADVITVQGIASGTPLIVSDGGGAITVDGTVAVSGTVTVGSHEVTNAGTFAVQATMAAGTATIAKAEDAAHSSGDVGVFALAVRQDTAAQLAGTDGDYSPLITDANGRLHVTAALAASQTLATVTTVSTVTAVTTVGTITNVVHVDDNAGSLTVDAPVGTPVFVRLSDGGSAITALPVTDNSGSLTVDNAGAFAVQADGAVAHDAVDSGSPLKNGFKATTSVAGLTLVSNADRTDGFAGIDGVQIVRLDCNLEDIVTATPVAITDGSSTQVIAAQGSGIKFYLKEITIANSSATDVTVDLRDGTGGAVKWTFPVPAGGGVVKTFSVPLPFSANTAVAADPSAAASTITVSVVGFKSKV